MKALITSGGGAKGAFSVGALKALNQYGKGDFDIISGTSTGSLIAGLAAVKRYDILETEYTSGSNRDFLEQSSLINNLTSSRPYIYSTSPLEDKIDTYITMEVFNQIMDEGTFVCFSSVSLQTGRRTVFTTRMFVPPGHGLYDLIEIRDYSMFKNSILASTNQAAFLPPVSIDVNNDGRIQQFVDGGNRDVLPTQPAVDLAPDEIFALSNNPLNLFQNNQMYTDLFKVLFRALSIFIQDIRDNDYKVLDNYQGGTVYKIQPQVELDRNNPTGLNFNIIDMMGWMRLGELTAKRVLRESGEDIV